MRLVREQCIDCYAACFRKRVVLFERVLLTEACRGKGSTLFPSFQTVLVNMLCFAVYAIVCVLTCLCYVCSLMGTCLHYLCNLHMIWKIYV